MRFHGHGLSRSARRTPKRVAVARRETFDDAGGQPMAASGRVHMARMAGAAARAMRGIARAAASKGRETLRCRLWLAKL